MIKVTACRRGKFPCNNIAAKGCFTLTFNNLNEFARFYVRSFKSVWFPKLDKELTKRQIHNLSQIILHMQEITCIEVFSCN